MKKFRSCIIGLTFMKATAFVCLLLCSFISVRAQVINTQPHRADARTGNKEYAKGNYADAEAGYKKALDKKNNMPEAIFNLGNAMYEQKRYDEALKQFQLAAQTNPDTTVKAKAYHNIGNVHLQQEKWEEAAKAYKTSLKLRPNDAETRYNLAYANAKLKQQKGEGGQNQQQKKDEQDKKDDKQKQDQDKDKQGDKDKQDQNKDGDKKEDKDGQQKPGGQQPKLSKEEAEQMLKALAGEEQKTNQKVQQKQVKVSNIKIEKDW